MKREKAWVCDGLLHISPFTFLADKRRLAGKMGEIELEKWHSVLLEMLG